MTAYRAVKICSRTRQGGRAVRLSRQQRHAHLEDGRDGEGVDGVDRLEDGLVGLHEVTKMSFLTLMLAIVSESRSGFDKKVPQLTLDLVGTQSADSAC
jgi:hypothetical protein